MTIKFKKLSDGATQPIRTDKTGAGYNLTVANVSTKVNERGQVIVIYHSGIGIEVPTGFEAVLRPASDIANKTLRMCGSPKVLSGNIDEEIVAEFVTTTDVIPAVYNKNDVFAQLVIIEKEEVDWVEVETEISAGEGDQSPLEKEGEPTNSDEAEAPSGGEANVPEEA
jgi:dUTPase